MTSLDCCKSGVVEYYAGVGVYYIWEADAKAEEKGIVHIGLIMKLVNPIGQSNWTIRYEGLTNR